MKRNNSSQSNSKSEDTLCDHVEYKPTGICVKCGWHKSLVEPPQDTSLDEQLMEVMLYVRTTHEVEHNDNQWAREFVYSFDEAKAKINRLIVEAELKGFNIAFDSHDYDRLNAYRQELNNKLKETK